MKKTIKNYCFNPTQSKLNQLYEIAHRYSLVKNDIFHRYGSINGLKYISYPRKIRDEWIKTYYADRFSLQARLWKQAFDEAFANIKSNFSNAITKTRQNLYKNQNLNPDEKHYCFYLLKNTDLLYEAITFKEFDTPDKFKDKDIPKNKLRRYLKSRLRKHLGKKPHQNKNTSFQVDENMYDCYIDEKNRLWIGIMGLIPRKRIKLQMSSSIKPKGNLRVLLKSKTVEIHNAQDIPITPLIGKEKKAIDKGFSSVITSTSGIKYGEGFNNILKKESDRLSKTNKTHNKLFFLAKKYEERANFITAESIRRYNLGKKKYFHRKQDNLNNIKRFINYSLNNFFKQERPQILATEDLTFTNYTKKLSKKVKRYFSSWLKGYLQQRLNFKTMQNGVLQVVVNPAYSSQVCHLCNYFGIRKGDKFYCVKHGEMDADYNAASNHLARLYDQEITLYTPYLKVKQILQERLRLSNQDSRYPVLSQKGLGQSESESTH